MITKYLDLDNVYKSIYAQASATYILTMPTREEKSTVVAFRVTEQNAIRLRALYPYYRDRSKVLRKLLEMLISGKISVPKE